METVTLDEARRKLRHWKRMVEKLADEQCAAKGHIKGAGAFHGYSYCKTCRGQIANADFGKPASPG